MASAYYRPPEKRVTNNDHTAERHYQREPLAIGITASGRTELISASEAERIIEQLQDAIVRSRGESPDARLAERKWK